ncbi:MAG: sulfatase-like hydrolase/transferase, partial [Anaerolineales bacterium]
MNRRDFLKLFTFGMLRQLAPKFLWIPGMNARAGSSPNILVVVFDAWSAANVSLYGYPRETTPNINKLAEKAIVYHNHYSGGSFTSPGTASLLTGRYPWTHQVVKEFQMLTQTDIHKNIFSLLRDDFFQAAYTHNPLADTLIKQQSSNITEYVSREKLYLTKDIVFDRWLTKDYQFANLARQLAFYQQLQRFQPSILFQWIYQLAIYQDVEEIEKKYPRGIPTMGDSAQRFSLEESIDWIINNASDWQAPFFGYFHLLPPHEPYNTRQEFIDVFRDDGFIPEEKPMHPFSI